ncbi:MAG: DUF72 domain-containing protein [Candidatus Aenigmatarchaeota archaeon]
MEVFVGCCGFPVGMKKYFQEFSLVEIQQTFYKIPEIKTLQRWREEAPKDFIFTIKAFQGISHPTSSPTWRRSGIEELKKLRDKVGFLKPTKEVFDFWKKSLETCKILNSPVCLIQLPAGFKENEENKKNAKKFFSKIERKNLSIALELRGWGEGGFKEICKKFDLISCVDPFVSQPLYFSKKKIAYFRLHGRYEKGRIDYKHKYSEEELKKLKGIVEGLGVKKVFVLFNNVFMREDALRFKELMKV